MVRQGSRGRVGRNGLAHAVTKNSELLAVQVVGGKKQKTVKRIAPFVLINNKKNCERVSPAVQTAAKGSARRGTAGGQPVRELDCIEFRNFK